MRTAALVVAALVLVTWSVHRSSGAAAGPRLAAAAQDLGRDAGRDGALPEPGPEDGGLRLRLIVAPRAGAAGGYDVRLDLLNESARAVTLRSDWRNRDVGDVGEYLEAALNVECVPPVAPWVGGVMVSRRELPQAEHALAAGETLTVRWQTDKSVLKRRVSNPHEAQNPTFPFPGLYSVHGTLDVVTADGTVRLRSNEQLVPVGGSRAMPKYTYGTLRHVDGATKTAILGLGSMHQARVGDRFEIGHSKGMHWRLTLTDVRRADADGTLELLTRSPHPPYADPPLPLMPAALVPGADAAADTPPER